MQFSYDRAWSDVMAMARANLALLATLAGAFLFLPSFAFGMFVARPVAPSGGDGSQALTLLIEFYQANAVPILIVTLIATIGQIALLALLLDRGRPTVADALRASVRLLLPYLGLTFIGNFALVTGFALFIVPGLYLLGRLAVTGPTMVAERIGNPLTAIQHGWAHTTGRGWRIAGFLILVLVVGWIGLSAASSAIGVVAGLLLPEAIKAVVSAATEALVGAAIGLLAVLLSAAIYRQIASGQPELQDVFS